MPRKRTAQQRDIPRGYGYVQDVEAPEGLHKVQARWQDGVTSRAKTFTAPTRQEAHDAAIDHLVAMHRARRDGRAVTPSMMTVGDLMDVYIDRSRSGWHGSTEHVYRGWSDRWIVDRLGSVRVVTLGKAQLQDWTDHMGRAGLGPRTVRNVVMLLRAALGHAVDMEIVAKNPAVGIKLPEPAEQVHATWDRAQIGTILAHVAGDPYMDAYYQLALRTGMRPGELRAVQWGDLDLDAATVTIRRTVARDPAGNEVLRDRPKTGRQRTVALTPGVIAALEMWQAEQARTRRASRQWDIRGFVFTTRNDGAMCSREAIMQRHERAIREAGVPRITLHSLRHAFATIAMETGAHPLIVSQVLGHRHVSQTLDTYSHPSTVMQRDALTALEQATTPVAPDAESGAKGT